MNLASRLEGPFSSNSVLSVAIVIVDEKTSLSLVDRLDEVANRELHKKEFKNVTLILRAIDQVISKDTDCIHRLINQGVVLKVTELLKTQQVSKDSVQLIEVFYEVSMSLCQSDVEGSHKILEVLLLRFGAVVIDQEVNFRLRLEAIKTINSMLDSASKESRKKVNENENRDILLEEFAKVIIDVGDYEMQVAISEALYRLTSKKMREELASKWFSYRSFASTFTTIAVKDFETDCRMFLNELNDYFGSSRRVHSFPCVKAFLGPNELFKPKDELLSEFWVDFNVGTSCISFFVHDPEATLWGLINLSKQDLSSYSLQECENRKFLSSHMKFPISHGSITSQKVQIIFDSKYDIQTAVEKVFPGTENMQPLGSPNRTSPVEDDSGIPVTPTDLQSFDSSSVTESTERAQVCFFPQSGPGRLPSPKGRRIQAEDTFLLRNDSDTEVTVSATLNHTFLTDVSGRSHHTKPETITFMAALWRYQVVRAKAVIFCQQQSSNGSVKSLPATVSEVKSVQKRKLGSLHSESDSPELFIKKRSSKNKQLFDYTRRKPRPKTKLKVLPLSSPSSNEEGIKASTSKRRPFESERTEARLDSLDVSHPSKKTSLDSDYQDSALEDSVLVEDSVFVEDTPAPSLENKVGREPPQTPQKRFQQSTELHAGSEVTEKRQQKEEKSRFKPRRLPYTSQESDTETMTQALMEKEPETAMNSGVIAAFNTFKAQLKEHFSSRYKQIEAKSLRSLSDCQKNMTSLLRITHQQRLVHLEHFQDTVVQQLGQLEQNCLSLENIERETVRFWQSQSGTVKAFCDEQWKRLEALDRVGESIHVSRGQTRATAEPASESSDAHTSLFTPVLNNVETEEEQREPTIVPVSTTSK